MGAAIDIASFLAAEGHGTIGTDVWAHSTPNTPNALISVYSFGSPMSLKSHGKGSAVAVWAIKENLQVQNRHTSRSTADSTARSIFNTLESNGGFTQDGTIYLYIECTRFPGQLRVDDNDRTIFYAEYRCIYRSGL